jgi:enamine deaminase RidA (YjgF/YER057c/UK114 family)
MISDPNGTAVEGALASPAPATRRMAPTRAPASEFVLTCTPRSGEPTGAVFHRLAADLAAHDAELVSLMLFGSVAARDEIDVALRDALGETAWPITWVEGASCSGHALAGVQAFAVTRRPVTRIRVGNRIVGSVYEESGAQVCVLGGLEPTSIALTRAAQTQQLFGNMEWALERAGFTLADVVRTWFYNESLLDWYGDFNRVRSALYSNVKFRTGSMPASTGVEGRNPAGAALAVAAWAIRPAGGKPRAFEVGSPLQCPAPAYGSAFSRAMEVEVGGWRRLFVSGTASIFPDGKSAWIDNPAKQVDLTMEVIAAILESRGMSFGDVTRATAYFKSAAFKPHFDAWCARHELRRMPVVPVKCDICRDDLLFELELDAARLV